MLDSLVRMMRGVVNESHRNDRNPATRAPLKIKASKVPAFKAGATLKAAVNDGKK